MEFPKAGAVVTEEKQLPTDGEKNRLEIEKRVTELAKKGDELLVQIDQLPSSPVEKYALLNSYIQDSQQVINQIWNLPDGAENFSDDALQMLNAHLTKAQDLVSEYEKKLWPEAESLSKEGLALFTRGNQETTKKRFLKIQNYRNRLSDFLTSATQLSSDAQNRLVSLSLDLEGTQKALLYEEKPLFVNEVEKIEQDLVALDAEKDLIAEERKSADSNGNETSLRELRFFISRTKVQEKIEALIASYGNVFPEEIMDLQNTFETQYSLEMSEVSLKKFIENMLEAQVINEQKWRRPGRVTWENTPLQDVTNGVSEFYLPQYLHLKQELLGGIISFGKKMGYFDADLYGRLEARIQLLGSGIEFLEQREDQRNELMSKTDRFLERTESFKNDMKEVSLGVKLQALADLLQIYSSLEDDINQKKSVLIRDAMMNIQAEMGLAWDILEEKMREINQELFIILPQLKQEAERMLSRTSDRHVFVLEQEIKAILSQIGQFTQELQMPQKKLDMYVRRKWLGDETESSTNPTSVLEQMSAMIRKLELYTRTSETTLKKPTQLVVKNTLLGLSEKTA